MKMNQFGQEESQRNEDVHMTEMAKATATASGTASGTPTGTPTGTADNFSDWCPIESDPGVFTELIRGFGCVGAQMEEIWTLDADAFCHLEPIHGLIFLFKWIENDEPAGRVLISGNGLDTGKDIFFAKQVVTNACATQAILCLLLNLNHKDIELGETLSKFKELTQNSDPYTRGLNLGKSERIRNVHNSFARPDFFDLEALKQQSGLMDDDVYHFVGYMPIGNHLYELDGMQEGPIELGKINDGQNWLDVVRPIIEARMQRYSVGEIHFNLMALVSDRQRYYERQIASLQQPDGIVGYGALSESQRQLEIAHLQTFVKFELDKKRRYNKENLRRRHNYLPFILELLKQLGETGQLMPIYEKAKERSMLQTNHQMMATVKSDSHTETGKLDASKS